MSNIIRARQELHEIALKAKAEGNQALAAAIDKVIEDHMHRRKAVRRAPNHSAKVTPAIKSKIKDLADTTDMHSSEIASALGVNPGRVSEVLQGDK